MFDFKWLFIGLLLGSVIGLDLSLYSTNQELNRLGKEVRGLQGIINADGN